MNNSITHAPDTAHTPTTQTIHPDGQHARNRNAEEHTESTSSVIAAIAANIAIGIVKFIAAAISGSSAMISEGIHSIVDSGNGLLILLGIKKSKQPADKTHPFGYGKELYFWTLVVAIMIFALGGGFSIYEGAQHMQEVARGHVEIGNTGLNYIVLVISAIIEGLSLRVAIKTFNEARGSSSVFSFIKQAKDPSLFTVVLEDSAALSGLLVALVGVTLTHVFQNPYFDGAASIIIGLLLAGVAVILLRETKGLLIGEGADKHTIERIEQLVESNAFVVECGRILTMYMGPHDMLVALDATFTPDATRDDIMYAIDDIEASIVQELPDVTRIFIESESLRTTLQPSL
ncbi:MAG: cation transporter [Eggerthellaceae bacterium]|nr:cation transporter [Eggerthellaceae bacterium]